MVMTDLTPHLRKPKSFNRYTVQVKASFTPTGKEVTLGTTSSSLFRLAPFCLEPSYPYPSLAASHYCVSPVSHVHME